MGANEKHEAAYHGGDLTPEALADLREEPRELNYGDWALAMWTVGTDANGLPYAIRHTNEGWRFSHVCTSPRSGIRWRIAPLLQIGNGHTIISTDPLHIEASILCEDCGTHGWVRDGKWVAA